MSLSGSKSKTKASETFKKQENQTTSGVQTSSQSLNPWSLEQYNTGKAGILGTLDNYNQSSPYKAYSGPLTAGLTDAERQARALISARQGQSGLLGQSTDMISRASNAGPNLTDAARVQGLSGYNPANFSGANLGDAATTNAPQMDALTRTSAPTMGALSNVNAPQLGQARQVMMPNLGKAKTFEAASAGSAQIGAMDQIGNRLGEIDKYQNPELSRVVDTTLTSYDEDAARSRARMQAQGAAAGKFGGSRFGIEQGVFGADVARNRAGLEAGLRSSAYDRATGLLGSDVGTVNQGRIAQAGMDQQANMANAAAENAARASNTAAQNQFLMQQGLLGFQADQYNVGAENARDSERAGYSFSANQQNTNAANQRASEMAGYDASANQFNASAANQRASERAGYDASTNQFNASSRNQRDSERAQMQQQTGLFNAGAANDASRYGADVNNQGILANAGYQQQANLTNAQAREQALGRQMQGGGLLANIQNQQFGQDMQVADSLRQMGMDERQIADLQILREMAQYDRQAADQLQRVQMQLQAQFGLLGAAPMLLDSRQTTDGTMTGNQSGSGSSTSKTSEMGFKIAPKFDLFGGMMTFGG
jgi:hypothetical protein